jgi:acetyl esterase
MPDTRAREVVPLVQRLEGRLARLLAHVPGAWLLRVIGERPTVIDGQTLDPHVQFILARRRRKPAHLMGGPTPEEARRRNRLEIRAVSTDAGATPTEVHAVRTLTVPGATGALNARHYVPRLALTDSPPPLLVFIHGGGFVICDLDTHDEACRILCQYGDMQVLSITYRLAPEHPFPAGFDDCCAALQWAVAHAAELGADPQRVCVGGDSAAANLAIGAAHSVMREGALLAAQLLIYPTTDFKSAGPSKRLFADGFILTARDIEGFEQQYIGHDAALRADPRVSPARSTTLASSPPTYVVTAGFDPLRDEGEAYAAALTASGVTTRLRRETALTHGFLHLTTVVTTARTAVVTMAAGFRAFVDATGAGSDSR